MKGCDTQGLIVRAHEKPPPAGPKPLCRYVAAKWPDESDPFRAWCRARADFAAEYPDAPLGGVLAEHCRIKKEAAS